MATMAGDPIFVDTNVLVYASVTHSPFHQAALSSIVDREQAGIELWVSWQILREYLAVLTRPQAFVHPAPISTLAAQVRAFESRFQMAEEGAQVTSNLLALLTQVPTGGKQVHDANLVATMQVYGLRRRLTHNVADFQRFSQFIEIVPVA